MTPPVVVDIGNSRMKWGHNADGQIAAHAALNYDCPQEWRDVLARWQPVAGPWLIAGVAPERTEHLREWLSGRGIESHVLENDALLRSVPGFRTLAEEPERIGIDRLLNALAAHRLAAADSPEPIAAAVISVGTAVTVDFVEADGTHIGGAIYPGPRLMARSLHESTALLPEVSVPRFNAAMQAGQNTEDAIRLGIARAVVHAADGLLHDWAVGRPFALFLTGGDAGVFRDFVFTGSWTEVRTEPALVLEGLRLAAEMLP